MYEIPSQVLLFQRVSLWHWVRYILADGDIERGRMTQDPPAAT